MLKKSLFLFAFIFSVGFSQTNFVKAELLKTLVKNAVERTKRRHLVRNAEPRIEVSPFKVGRVDRPRDRIVHDIRRRRRRRYRIARIVEH